jgi:regulatory protein
MAADPQARRRAAALQALAAAEARAGRDAESGVHGSGERRGDGSGERAAAVSPQSRTRAGGRTDVGERTRIGGRAAPPPDSAAEGREPDPEDVARAIVLQQLSIAPRSRHQLADKLRQRGCPDDVSTQVLDRMEAVGLVDDDAYAQMVVRSKQATRGLAKRALAQELRVKGVGDDTIEDALGSIDPESERALAEQVADKAMRRLAGLDPQVQARRLAGVLGRKGYPPSVVYAVVRDAVNDAPEHQRD